ncbi:CPBP family intramembrane glutamic endopeptidase [Streptomyces sp. NPDC059161]|uniref:CPBP family intramembrane glutamic endopeptidase n=1 Tax=Streptomyces sp. NPDC059161 TaxID=3346749 RepID=UPI0036B779E2
MAQEAGLEEIGAEGVGVPGARGMEKSGAEAFEGKGVVVFLALSFGLTWLWLLFARRGLGLTAVNPLLQLPYALGPGIVAGVVRRWVTKEGFADAGLRLRLRQAWPYWIIAWLGPLGIAAASVALAAALGLWEPDLAPLGEVLSGLPGWAAVAALMLVVPVLTPLYCGEEFGWTSYLRPRLFGGRTVPSVLATGLIWALWHFPLAFIGYVEFRDRAVGLAAWTVSFLVQEVLLWWLYRRSGSVWVASLAHSGNNMVLFLLVGQLLGSPGAGLGDLATTVLPTLAMAPLAVLCLLDRSPRLDRSRRAHAS